MVQNHLLHDHGQTIEQELEHMPSVENFQTVLHRPCKTPASGADCGERSPRLWDRPLADIPTPRQSHLSPLCR